MEAALDTRYKAVAGGIAESFGINDIISVERMTTGLCHYVYEVTSPKKTIVVRIALPENRGMIESALYWYEKLKPLDVPLATILKADYKADIPFMILERLPGKDLGDVYTALTEEQKRDLAFTLQDIQSRVNGLPLGRGYGYVPAYESEFPYNDAFSFYKDFTRNREWINKVGFFKESIVDPVESAFDEFKDYFKELKPTPFLHDITTKNVIVNKGALSGIVDVDDLCFGDPIKTMALTQTALLSSGWDDNYIEYWSDAAELDDLQKRVLALYTAECACAFLGELGQAFNKDTADPVDMDYACRLVDIINSKLTMALEGRHKAININDYII